MIRLPGLIDVHVHLRDPGQTEKEDFYTGTLAALAGGFTTILDMPNNKVPITSIRALEEKQKIASEKKVCDVGFFFGSLGENLEDFNKIQSKVFGLKIYLNQTTGNYIINEIVFKKICQAWPKKKPILLHAEDDAIEKMIEIASRAGQRIHICHVSSKKELQIIIETKKKNYKVTCGVTPHHLFLTGSDEKALGQFGIMKPALKSKEDVDFIWKNLKYVDVIESDHAPHTKEEKKSEKPHFGVPGLETTLPLLLTAVSQKKLSLNRLIELCFENPKKIFNIKTDKNTYVEIDEKEEYIIDNKNLKTKCGWSPFNGWKVKGKVKKVFIRGKKVFENGKLFVNLDLEKLLNRLKLYYS
ncbi:MAG: amidohydrolase family protein [Patescibacteria group bacterium]|jgi:carbamoyl-phosphate synthase/aspartate carbamoyltransferase/dihydroorotase